MTEESSAPDWPAYKIPPKDTLIALGLVTLNFNKFELMVLSLFGLATAIPAEILAAVFARLNQDARIDLMKKGIKLRDWPEAVSGRFLAAVEAYNSCAASRHVLMHSVHPDDATQFYKLSKKGAFQTGEPKLADIRQVADETTAWFNFSLALLGATLVNRQPDDSFFEQQPWPDIPAPPHNLSHTFLVAQA